MNIDRELVARAMDKAGEEPINDIEWTEGTSTRVRLIKDFYLATILETLSGTDWTSQKKRAALELSDDVNLSNYYYMYNLPLDCAKPCNLVNDEDFYCEGGFLFSNTENAVLIYVKNYFTGKYTYRIVREPDTENITRYYTYNDETDEYTQATEYDMSNTYYERVDEDYNFYAQPVFDSILSEAVETRLASKIVLKLNGDNNKYQLLYSEAMLAANNAVKNSAKHARNKNHGNKYWAQELGWEDSGHKQPENIVTRIIPVAENQYQYKVLETCYWNGKLYQEGRIVGIDNTLTPPQAYFTRIEE